MRNIVFHFLIGFLTIIMSACAEAKPDNIEGMINPGDQIDGMEFHPIAKFDWDISLIAFCDFEHVEDTGELSTASCAASTGDRVFFGNCNGVWFDNPEDADELWGELDLEVAFDGNLINLPPFGYLDIDLINADKKYARIWNLMVENISSGRHVIECKEGVEGGAEIKTFIFSVLE